MVWWVAFIHFFGSMQSIFTHCSQLISFHTLDTQRNVFSIVIQWQTKQFSFISRSPYHLALFGLKHGITLCHLLHSKFTGILSPLQLEQNFRDSSVRQRDLLMKWQNSLKIHQMDIGDFTSFCLNSTWCEFQDDWQKPHK